VAASAPSSASCTAPHCSPSYSDTKHVLRQHPAVRSQGYHARVSRADFHTQGRMLHYPNLRGQGFCDAAPTHTHTRECEAQRSDGSMACTPPGRRSTGGRARPPPTRTLLEGLDCLLAGGGVAPTTRRCANFQRRQPFPVLGNAVRMWNLGEFGRANEGTSLLGC
jgi:hypothetical protein